MLSKLEKLFTLPVRDESTVVAKPPRAARTPTPDERSKIVECYESGSMIREVATTFGFDRCTISSVLHHEQVETRYHQRVPVDLERAEGLTITEVAAATQLAWSGGSASSLRTGLPASVS